MRRVPQVENELLLSAAPAAVWATLMDTAGYPAWNPRLRRVDGTLRAGGVVTLHYEQDRPWMPRRYVVDVDACEAGRELRWSGPRNAARSLLRASHWFRLEPAPGGGSRFVHGERFEGALAAALWPLIGASVARSHAAVNEALERRCAAA